MCADSTSISISFDCDDKGVVSHPNQEHAGSTWDLTDSSRRKGDTEPGPSFEEAVNVRDSGSPKHKKEDNSSS